MFRTDSDNHGGWFAAFCEILAVFAAGLLLAIAVNSIHPKGIPWVRDWERYVEARAKAEGIEVVSLHLALSYHQLSKHLFVDARPTAEYTQGRIAGAVSLPFEELEIRLETLEHVLSTETRVVIYCRNRECDDALVLAVELRDMGQSNLFYYVDGFELWKESGCPVQK